MNKVTFKDKGKVGLFKIMTHKLATKPFTISSIHFMKLWWKLN